MRRAILTLLAVIVSAILLNVMCAWACVWFEVGGDSPLDMPSFWKEARDDTWMGPGRRGPGWTTVTLYGTSGFTQAGLDHATLLPSWIDPPRTANIEERAVHVVSGGWPLRSLVAHLPGRGDYSVGPGGWSSGLGPQRVHWAEWTGAIVLIPDEKATESSRVLPRRIIPLGFALNVLFWSLPGLLIVAFRQARRTSRRRRGRCAPCGHQLDIADVCPECGRAR